ncbi:MAG: argininosuccinate synthase [Actinomycetota bacterium]
MKKVVLAYSGGLDTSVAIPWLSDQGWAVVAVAVDVGQPSDLERAVTRAGELGAVEARRIDARNTFAQEFILPALHMNALYQGRYPLVSALSRPLIARLLAEVAEEVGATAVAHGCTGKGNDQVRFEVALAALAPDIEVLAPVRDWGMSRAESIAYAADRGLPIADTSPSPYSIDENLWGRSIECGALEDPWASPPEDAFKLTVPPGEVSGERELEISFEAGVPVAVDGETMDPLHVIDALTKLAGEFGFGRVDMVEDRLVGIKSREVYEAPAALTLINAHSELESLTLERNFLREKRRIDALWTQLVYEGMWFSPLHQACNSFASVGRAAVTGDVRLMLRAGSCAITGRRSPHSLYDHGLATYGQGDSFEHADAAGFIRLWGLSTRQWARADAGN